MGGPGTVEAGPRTRTGARRCGGVLRVGWGRPGRGSPSGRLLRVAGHVPRLPAVGVRIPVTGRRARALAPPGAGPGTGRAQDGVGPQGSSWLSLIGHGPRRAVTTRPGYPGGRSRRPA